MEMSQIEKKSRKCQNDTLVCSEPEQSYSQIDHTNNTYNTNNNMDTSSTEAGSILDSPEEKEFYF